MDFYQEALIRKDEIIKKVQELVKINSVLDESTIDGDAPFGKGIKEALDYMIDLGKKEGFKTKNSDHYAGHIEMGEGKELIGVLAHLDVVPVQENWKFPPFSGTLYNERIYGRGSLDDKGPLVAAYFAMKILKEKGIKLNKRVRLILGCDEETGVLGMEHYFKEEEMPSIGFSPDAEFPVINGEKGIYSFIIKGEPKEEILMSLNAGTRLNIVPDFAEMTLKTDMSKEFHEFLMVNHYEGGVKGGVYFVKGKSSHAMQPQKGLNAISLLVDFIKAHFDSPLATYLDKYLTYSNFGEKLGISDMVEPMGNLTMNLGFVHFQENHMEIGINIRYPHERDIEIINHHVEESLGDFSVEYLPLTPVHFIHPDSELVRVLMASYQKYTNDFDSKPICIGGGTYAKVIPNGVAFGPLMVGKEDMCHQVDEFLDVDDLLKSVAIYCDAIYRLAL